MANKKYVGKFGLNESISVRVPKVAIIIAHISPEAVICLVALLPIYTGTK